MSVNILNHSLLMYVIKVVIINPVHAPIFAGNLLSSLKKKLLYVIKLCNRRGQVNLLLNHDRFLS